MLIILLSACRNHGDVDTIAIDLSTADTVFIDTSGIVPMETSDSSMIYDINALELTDSLYIVHSRDYLRSYSRQDGTFRGDIATKGKAAEQFSHIGNISVSGDTVSIFDPNNSSTLYYLTDGRFLGREDFKGIYSDGEKPRQCFVVSGLGTFTTSLSTDHTTPANPKYCFYHAGSDEAMPISGREVIEPTTLADGTYADIDGHRLLSWEPLRDTIFSVTERGIEPLFHVDFGANALPAEVQGLPYIADRAKVFNSASGKPYASLIRYVQRKDGKLYFAFACSDEKNFLASFDEATGATKIRHLRTKDGTFSQTTFFKIYGDSAYVEILDRTDALSNPYICPIPLNNL